MAITKSDEKILLKECLQGKKLAWQNFIKKYSPLIYYCVQQAYRSRGLQTHREEIDDLHNEIILTMMDQNGKKLRQYEGKNGCSIASWVRMIAVRASIDHLRKKKNTISLSAEKMQEMIEKKSYTATTPQQGLENEEQKKFIKELIGMLSPRDQLFLKLYYYEGVSPQIIAKIFQSSTNAIYSRNNYLREKLRKGLEKRFSKKLTVNSSITVNRKN